MSDKRIVYRNDEGGVSVIVPTGDLPVEQTALKDVPKGVPFAIVSVDDIEDQAGLYKAARTVDLTDPDGVGADYGVGSNNVVVGVTQDGELVTVKAIRQDIGGMTHEFLDSSAKPVTHPTKMVSQKGRTLGIDLEQAKAIAHERRRARRGQVFKPDLAVTAKAAQGIPLKKGESTKEALARMQAYKDDVDDRTQVDIDKAKDLKELETIERTHGFIEG